MQRFREGREAHRGYQLSVLSRESQTYKTLDTEEKKSIKLLVNNTQFPVGKSPHRYRESVM